MAAISKTQPSFAKKFQNKEGITLQNSTQQRQKVELIARLTEVLAGKRLGRPKTVVDAFLHFI